MARETSINTRYTGDASGAMKAAKDAARAARIAAKESEAAAKAAKRAMADAGTAFSELGNLIGGAVGDITGGLISLASAGGPILAVAAAIGVVAIAWKNSKENLELYLKTADKLKYGFAGFSSDANAQLEETRQRARGQRAAGQTAYAAAFFGLQRKDLTEEQRKALELQLKQAEAQRDEGQALLDSLKFFKGRNAWTIEYNKLLQEQETISDRVKGIDAARWEGLEAELNRQRIIVREGKDKKSVTEALAKAEQISFQLQTEKTAELDAQINNLVALSKMTATEEATEEQIFQWQKEKQTVQREYGKDQLMILKLQKASGAELKDQLNTAKQFNTHTSEGYKIGQSDQEKEYLTRLGRGRSRIGIGLPSASGLRPYGGLSSEEMKSMMKLADYEETLAGVQNIVNGLENAFVNLFTSISAGSKNAFADMAKAFGRALTQMAAQLAARSAIFGILSLLSGGTGIIANFATDILDGRKLGKFLGFAGGTNFAPGGMALVGERGPELVNLPRGSQVIPNKSLGMGGEVVFKIEGTTLVGVLSNQTRKVNSFR